jgi:hypothetical protein
MYCYGWMADLGQNSSALFSQIRQRSRSIGGKERAYFIVGIRIHGMAIIGL